MASFLGCSLWHLGLYYIVGVSVSDSTKMVTHITQENMGGSEKGGKRRRKWRVKHTKKEQREEEERRQSNPTVEMQCIG